MVIFVYLPKEVNRMQTFTLSKNWSLVIGFSPHWDSSYKNGCIFFSLFKDTNNYLEIENCNDLYIVNRVIDGVWKPFSLLKPLFLEKQSHIFMITQSEAQTTFYLYCNDKMVKTTTDGVLLGKYSCNFGYDFTIDNTLSKFVSFLLGVVPENDAAALAILANQTMIKVGQKLVGTFRVGQIV
jgi:hypothetical protein